MSRNRTDNGPAVGRTRAHRAAFGDLLAADLAANGVPDGTAAEMALAERLRTTQGTLRRRWDALAAAGRVPPRPRRGRGDSSGRAAPVPDEGDIDRRAAEIRSAWDEARLASAAGSAVVPFEMPRRGKRRRRPNGAPTVQGRAS